MLKTLMRNRNHLNWTAAAIITVTLIVFGCGGGGGSSSSDGGGAPEIGLSTGQISFGNVVANSQGLKSADRSVQVTNTGTANLSFGQVAQANVLDPPFSKINDNCSGVSLAPNASCSIVVRFQPTQPQDNFTDSFDIPSNDADEPSLTVSVVGNGKGLNVTINQVDTINHPTIRMVVTVTDADDNPITGLDGLTGSFTYSEAGISPQLFNTVSGTVTSPVSVAMTLDNSESLTADQVNVKNAAKGFLDNLAPTDEAAVIKFSGQVDLIKDFTTLTPSGRADLETAINANYNPTAGTRFFDAAYDSVELLSQRNAAIRRAAIIVSDGIDYKFPSGGPLSTNDLEDVIANAQENQIFIYTIGLGTADTVTLGRMADETEGIYFPAPNSADLNSIYLKISQILSNQYELTFNASRPNDTLNSLQVFVNDGNKQGDSTVSVVY